MTSTVPKSSFEYISELALSQDEAWLYEILFHAVQSSGEKLDADVMEGLLSIFLKPENSSKEKFLASTVVYDKKDVTDNDKFKLEYIGEYKNFKKLSDNVSIDFNSPITIVFGANGAGKSSICSSIRVLVDKKPPKNPLGNVIFNSKEPVSFSFKTSNSGSNKESWNIDSGFGFLENKIKYFDSGISINYVRENPDAEKVVEISPFRLEIFEYLESYVIQFREFVDGRCKDLMGQTKNKAITAGQMFTAVKADIPSFLLAAINSASFEELIQFHKTFIKLTDDEILKIEELVKTRDDLKKLTSVEGQELLKREVKEHQDFLLVIKRIVERLKKLDIDNMVTAKNKLEKLKKEQAGQVKSLIHREDKVKEFKEFIKKSIEVVNYRNKDYSDCLFCKKPLDEKSLDIIYKYYDFLDSSLEKEIAVLQKKQLEDTDILENMATYDFDKLIDTIPKKFEGMKASLSVKIIELKKFLAEGDNYLILGSDVKSWNTLFDKDFAELIKLLQKFETNSSESLSQINILGKKITQAENEIYQLKVKKIYGEELEVFNLLNENISKVKEIKSRLDSVGFKGLFLKITGASKKAYSGLVVEEFRAKFAAQYKDLTERNIEDAGVQIQNMKGEERVDIKTTVQGHSIQTVHSEGEQKMYALSLFFAEVLFEDKPILVFDDPVSSLDYNYVENFCIKLKNYIRSNPEKQIIVFTHDWYFLKDLQFTLHESGLEENKGFDVFIVENCSDIKINIEKIDDLKKYIATQLAITTPISSAERDDITRAMRRLVETIINKHVFNNERTQFKRDKMAVSVFKNYVGLKPLTLDLASRLSDLYKKICPSSHDNPSTEFTNPDRAVLKTRFEALLEIEKEILKIGV